MIHAWRQLRRRSAPAFVRRMAERHPELAEVVRWPQAVAIVAREGVALQRVVLPARQKARLLRLGDVVVIQVNRALSRAEATVHVMHELVHLWRDDPGVACYHSADGEDGADPAAEEFADVVAWYVTSPARTFVDAIGEER